MSDPNIKNLQEIYRAVWAAAFVQSTLAGHSVLVALSDAVHAVKRAENAMERETRCDNLLGLFFRKTRK